MKSISINETVVLKKRDSATIRDLLDSIPEWYAQNHGLRDVYAAVGNMFRFKGMHQVALDLFEYDRLFEKLSPAYRHILAGLLTTLKKDGEAIAEYKRTLMEDPSLEYGYCLLTNSILDFSKPDTAQLMALGKNEKKSNNRELARLKKKLCLLAGCENYERASSVVAEIYSKDSNYQDGYAFIGSVLRAYAQYEEALKYYEKDHFDGRLSPFQRVIYAQLLTRLGHLKQGEKEVNRAYSENKNVMNGYAFIGSVYRLEANYDMALFYYEEDSKLEKLSPAHRHIFADLLARHGRIKEAVQEIDRGYSESPYLKNGYARIGSICMAQGKTEEALGWYQKDQNDHRLYHVHHCNYAELLGISGKFNEANEVIESAYSSNPTLRDGFSRIAWHCWHQHRYSQMLQFFEKDYTQNRLSPKMLSNYAIALAASGRLDEAISIVKEAYAGHRGFRDFFVQVGKVLFFRFGDRDAAFNLMQLDADLGRLSADGMTIFVSIRAYRSTSDDAQDDIVANAQKDIEWAYGADTNLKDGYSKLAKAYGALGDLDFVADLFRQDIDRNRMSSKYFREYICFLMAAEKDTQIAAEEIDKRYQKEPNAGGMYAVLANECLMRGDPKRAFFYYEQDWNQGRITKKDLADYVRLLACLGQYEKIKKILDTELNCPDADRYCAIASAARVVPAETLPALPAPDLLCFKKDPVALSRILAAMAMHASSDVCINFAVTQYKHIPNAFDCLSCGARSALSLGDVDKAAELFSAEREMGFAERDSLLQYAAILDKKEESERICTEAFELYGVREDPWLKQNKNRHKGKRCFIVGTGPSMNTIDCRCLKDELVFAVNGAIYLKNLEPSYFVSVSDVFWRHHRKALCDLSCRRFLPYWMQGPLNSDCPTSWINAPLPRTKDIAGQPIVAPLIFSDQAHKFVALGGTVMFVCLQIAWHLGFSEIVFLGVDHNYGTDFGKHAGGTILNSNQFKGAHFMDNYYSGGMFHLDFFSMDRAYLMGKKFYENSGRRIYNATPGSKLKTYPLVELGDMFDGRI